MFVSPVFGGHIHHACLEGAHGFEYHPNDPHNDKSHGPECQSESLFQHTFEQGAAYSTGDLTTIPSWSFVAVISCLAHFECLPRLDTTVSYLELECDIGIGQEETDSILLRAPPASLS